MQVGTQDFVHVNHVQAGVDSMEKTIEFLGRTAPKYAGTRDAATLVKLQEFYAGQIERIRGYFSRAGVENAVRWGK